VASITADNSIGTFTDNNDGTWSWSYTPTDDFSTVTITVTAHGTNGSEASDSFDTSAANVAPSAAGLLAPASAAAGSSFNISLDAPTDASSADAAALHYAFDCGTGYGTAVDYASSGTTNSASCTALVQAHSGDIQAVKAKVFDKDGDSTEYTADVAILQPELLLDPSDYDFGDVVTGGIASKTFTVTNIGDSTLNITGTGIHGVNPFYFGIDTNNCYNASLAPSESCTIIVVFDPNYTGPRSATLDVTSNDPNLGTATATLAGNGVAPTIPDAALSPASHDFGQVKIGQASAPSTFTLTNNGQATLNITDIYLGGASPAWFTLGSTTCGSTLGASASCDIDVTFSPIGNGIKSALLKVLTNDPDSPIVSATLTGTSECTSTCYVDGVSGSDTNGGTSSSDAFKTIQKGVDVVNANGTVYVAAGTYNEDVSVAKTVDLRGAQYGEAVSGRTLADGSESTINGQITLNAANIKLDGFSIQKTVAVETSAIAVSVKTAGSGSSIKNNLIGNVTATAVSGNQSHAIGIYLENGPDNVTVADNLIDGIHSWASAQAIYIGDSSASNASTGAVIDGNTIENVTSDAKGAYAIELNNAQGSGATIVDNTIDTLNGHWVHGIGLEGPAPNVQINHNVFSNLTDTDGGSPADQAAIFFQDDPDIATAAVHRNSLAVGNDRQGVALHSTQAGTADATCNWWGDPAGPNSASGSDTLGSVTVLPWLASSDLDGACSGVAVGSAASDASGNEGSLLSASGSFTGSVASIEADNAQGTFVDHGDGTWTWSYLTNDNYSVTITVTAHGTNGSTATDSFNATATNVSPTATFNAPSSVTTNDAFNISLTSPVDPSSVDAGSLHYAFDCGSGYGTAIDYASSSTSSSKGCTAPASAGSVTVKGKIFDKDGGATEYTASVNVTSAATPHLTVTPSSHGFGTVNTGSSSAPFSFTVTNDGTGTLSLTSETLTGGDSSQFGIDSNTCGASLGAGNSCTVAVKFSPTTGGAKSATLHVVSTANNADATLTGTGNVVTPTGGKITIVLNTTPDGGSFDFQSALLPSHDYTLTDDGSNNSISWDGLDPITYKTQVLPQSGWTLDSIVCDSGDWSANLSARKVTINLADGDDITCTFSESQPVVLHGVPDVMVGTNQAGPWTGDNVYSTTVVAGQTVNQSIAKNQTKSFWVRVQNDSANADTFILDGTKLNGPNFTIKVFINGVNVTKKVNKGTYQLSLAGNASQVVEIRITATKNTKVGNSVNYDVSAVSSGGGNPDIARAHATRS
jgi:hypothetical protein